MKTAIISDYKLNWPAFSLILDRIQKTKIKFDPIVKIPSLEENANVVDYFSSLKQYGYEEGEDPDAIIYIAGKDKKHIDFLKKFFNKNKRLMYIKVDEAGIKYPYYGRTV